MLRLVHQSEFDDDLPRPPRRRSDYDDDAPRPERFGEWRRQRPSVALRVMRSLWLGIGFAVVAGIAYLAGSAGVFDPLLQPKAAPMPAAVVAARPSPAVQARRQPAALQAAAPMPSAQRLPMPDVQGLVLLIRNAIVALHQANLTGDYAVLRALAAPEFQQRNDAAALAQAFSGLRAANLDLGQVAAVNPNLYGDPAIDADGFLRLSGFVPLGGDAKADFEFAFQMVNGRWRLFGIGVHPPRDGAPKPPAAKPASATAVPDGATLMTLIRGSVLALNQANISGDYSVLRDLGASGFQEANSPAKLADAFANIRARGLDLSPIAVIDPRLLRPAAIDNNGYLRLAGYFPSRPEAVNFDLAFRFEGGKWRLFGIGVDTTPEQPAAASAQ